jgi:HK97 family phage portal protein
VLQDSLKGRHRRRGNHGASETDDDGRFSGAGETYPGATDAESCTARTAAGKESLMAETSTIVDDAVALVRYRVAERQMQQKGLTLQPLSGRGGWWTIVGEPFLGAWQRNLSINTETTLSYSALFACVSLISSDIGKLTFRLVEEIEDGVWIKTESPAFSPVLRQPNRYQTTNKYIEQYIVSKLIHGNTYVLKKRDNRNVVIALHVLDPTRVTPLVAQDESVYYELKRDDISGLPSERVIVPASEIIHDRMNCFFHPLIGISPIYACNLAATQGLSIQSNSNKMFSNGAVPGGVLTAPGDISDETALRIKQYWETEFTGDNVGKVALLGNDLQYKPMAFNAVDMQLIDQLKMTGEQVCTAFKVPAYMVGIGPPPPYANIEPLIQQYYSGCIQTLTTSCEIAHDKGLGILDKIDGRQFGTEFDVNDLIWMDSATKTKAAADGIGSGGMSPNEARKRYFGLGKVTGGDTPYLQQQMFALSALAQRDANDPFAKPEPAPQPADASPAADSAEIMDQAASVATLRRKAVEAFCAA